MSDIVDRLREASLNHDVLRFGWLAEAIDEIERLRAKIEQLENECYKKCGTCEFDYGRAAPPLARSGESG